MKIRTPSPAMAVACIALFVALGGTGIAAVNFARNAGAVDGRSAVKSSASLKRAAGKLVATKRKGDERGMIPSKFLADVPESSTFGASVGVADNATGAPTALGSSEGIGSLTASCLDQANAPGVEDPSTEISFTNTSGATINMAKRIGGGNAAVLPQPDRTVQSITINGSNTFELHVQHRNVDLLINGVVRQDGRGSADASCLFYGTFQVVD